MAEELIALKGEHGSGMLCRVGGENLLEVLHWGSLPDAVPDKPALADAIMAVVRGGTVDTKLDHPTAVGVMPQADLGYHGRFGLECDRDGAAAGLGFCVQSTRVGDAEIDVTATSGDGVKVSITASTDPSGMIAMEAAVANLGPGDLRISSLELALPVPHGADESLTFTGRHGRERSPQRAKLQMGTMIHEARQGRVGHNGPYGLIVGGSGFSEATGEVWCVQLEWSGNQTLGIELAPDRPGVLGGGELLLAGEVLLKSGESYTSPRMWASHSREGLRGLSRIHHARIRANDYGASPSLRPVEINTWEAVHFDQDLDRLVALAERAAHVGVERFVLDDGWFRGRSSDRAGLGDWFVDERRWPEGLGPLVTKVRELGMDVGLWFEPEMVSVDSELIRGHPDWVLRPSVGEPLSSRSQVVLDLDHPDASAFVFARIESLVAEYDLDFIKWDHNRDLLPLDRGAWGAGPHRQTLALYALIDRLRDRFPALHIESCASGGGRADLGLAMRTHRVWTSDANDPVERAPIQWWTSLFLPVERLGMHVGPARSELSSRRQDLSFRAVTALFGWTGLELDLASLQSEELDQIACWIDYHRRHRELFHSGEFIRLDHPDAATLAQGVVAKDQRHAVFTVSQLATSVWAAPLRLRLAGLRNDARYRLRTIHPTGVPARRSWGRAPRWYERGIAHAPGWLLQEVGIALPYLHPEQGYVLEIEQLE
ncbi:MAG: alpha-galactosidase [Microbacterium sp.]|uniref:alpha-galactosidase n=1 Tax=Microbacterium sp. TaxID=51671 RepID=UPI0026363746|nr:alpha-galactosidase [Microbacterium sp.]MDF2562179.1 alpha-galactosidase [Microbacterium sp.]